MDNILGQPEEMLQRITDFLKAKEGAGAATRNIPQPTSQNMGTGLIDPQAYPGAIPEGYAQRQAPKDPLQEKIDRYMQRDFSVVNIPERFRRFDSVTFDFGPLKEDLQDNSLLNRPGIRDLKKAKEGVVTSSRNIRQPTSQNMGTGLINPQAYPGAIPEGYVQRQPPKDPLQEKLDRYMQRDFTIVNISEKFRGLDSVNFFDFRPVKEDFPDNSLLNQPGIRLIRGEDDQVAELGRVVIPMVSSGFTKQGAASIFILAYHLKTPGGKGDYVFGDSETLETIADRDYFEFSDKFLGCHGTEQVMEIIEDSAREASVYAYLAASMLRLFAKSPTNYVRAWNHIIQGYSRFYGKGVPIKLPTPSESVMKGLANWFSVEPRAKITLFRILYLSNMSEKSGGLKRFLYDIHLTNTGMHIVNMLVQLCKILDCSPGLILTIIDNGETARQIDCLCKILGFVKDTDSEAHKKRMWRYGRVFDENFMAPLQTSACPKLVYIFAEALKSVAPQSCTGVFTIRHLANVSDDNKRRCAAAGQQLVRAVRGTQAKSSGSRNTDVFY